MLIRDKDGNERIAYSEDFQDTSITLTPQEWQELCALLEYRKQTKPCAFAKANMKIYEKLMANPPLLRDGVTEIKTEDTMANNQANQGDSHENN